MALTGMCDHDEIVEPSSEREEIDANSRNPGTKKTKLSLFPPRPSNSGISLAGSATAAAANAVKKHSRQPVERPVGDLWLSVMCALGDGEADLAYMMLDNKNVVDDFGDTCDNFDR